MPDQVPEAVKEERLQILQSLLNDQTKTFNRSMIGKVLPVLLDRPGRHPGQRTGRSPFMQPVHVDHAEEWADKVAPIRITKVHPNSLAGTLETS
jgi:tRNA-2-methylthio-N6-dimethylallyladenosine synthase